jgi:uncharacterized protein
MANEPRRRLVLDTNTSVSAFLFPLSVPGRVFECVVERHRMLMSMESASELAEVLRREKFDRYLSRKHREELLAGAIGISEFVRTVGKITACRDPADNKFLELAVDGVATAIVSGDNDLLVMSPYRTVPIITPVQFLATFAAT